jgi:hypothetical protein
MKKWKFSYEDIIRGKNKADLYEGLFIADYIEYEIGYIEAHAYNQDGFITFYLEEREIERLERYKDDITAGDIFTAAWDFYDSREATFEA